jgi:hypothetical protein
VPHFRDQHPQFRKDLIGVMNAAGVRIRDAQPKRLVQKL